jgi:formamidopyrimidine-DNA glycosylase
MPELPEAETVARQIRAGLLGGRLTKAWVGRPDIVREGLPTLDWYQGGEVVGAARVGKSVVLTLSKGEERRHLVAELGMTGLLLFALPSPRYEKHRHVTLTLEGCPESRLHYWNPRRFGRVFLLDEAGLARFVARRFGPDPLTITWEEFHRLVASRRGRLKALLMRQQALAGIGNIYANEILFRTGLHPHKLAARLREPAVRRLHDCMQKVFAKAIEAGGSSVRDFIAPDGQRGRFASQHLVYNKEGQPCPDPDCRGVIRRLKGERSSFYCPLCQPPPRPRSKSA